MAETVGSIMENYAGKGRFLTEENLSKDLVLGENYTITDACSFFDISVGNLEQ